MRETGKKRANSARPNRRRSWRALLTGLALAFGATTVGIAGARWTGSGGAATASIVSGHVRNGPLGSSAGTFATLYTFTGNADGALPMSAPTVSPSGVVFGGTAAGGRFCDAGTRGYGCGTVYRLETDGSIRAIVKFNGSGNGWVADTNIAIAGTELYGAARSGGANGDGVLFSLKIDGSSFRIIKTFSGANGEDPLGNLALDANGNLFGTTNLGGSANGGAIFEVSQEGTYSVLYSFPNPTTNRVAEDYPTSLVLAGSGTIFGTTAGGSCNTFGHSEQNECGTVFSYVPATGVFTTLHAFKGHYDGAFPLLGGVNGNGTLFGATPRGAEFNNGGLFELRKDATGYTYRNIHTFTGGVDGGTPNQPYVDQHGNITGTTQTGGISGGQTGDGTLYTVPRGNNLTTLYTFSAVSGGINPHGQVIYSGGAFYGVTLGNGTQPCVRPSGLVIAHSGCGTIWKYTP